MADNDLQKARRDEILSILDSMQADLAALREINNSEEA